ncbi:MAG TPA: zf-HC2 domain-containing protein [Acidiferrobacterales bacterium]|nr:zf-HC2 domain-containing protein [Acidiferrobacterales bacterium]
MLSCKEVSLLLSKACDQKLAWRERLAVRLHLLYCRGCAQFEKHLQVLRAVASRLAQLGTLPDGARLSASARDRIRTALRRG